MSEKQDIKDSDGANFNPDDYYKIPSGMYYVNGKPNLLKHGDRLNGVLVIDVRFFNSGDKK